MEKHVEKFTKIWRRCAKRNMLLLLNTRSITNCWKELLGRYLKLPMDWWTNFYRFNQFYHFFELNNFFRSVWSSFQKPESTIKINALEKMAKNFHIISKLFVKWMTLEHIIIIILVRLARREERVLRGSAKFLYCEVPKSFGRCCSDSWRCADPGMRQGFILMQLEKTVQLICFVSKGQRQRDNIKSFSFESDKSRASNLN